MRRWGREDEKEREVVTCGSACYVLYKSCNVYYNYYYCHHHYHDETTTRSLIHAIKHIHTNSLSTHTSMYTLIETSILREDAH